MRHSLRPILSALIATTTLCAASSHGAEIQFGLSDHTVEIKYQSAINQRAAASMEWLHHEENGDMLAMGFYGKGKQGMFSGGLGAKFFALDADDAKPGLGGANDAEGQGVAVGGELRIAFHPQVALEADLHYSPSVTSFGDIENLTQAGARFRVTLFQGTAIFIGYRNVIIDVTDKDDARIHEGAYAGLRVQF
jgi:hypothetical protein